MENIKAFISLSLESLVNCAALSSKFQETGMRLQTAFVFFLLQTKLYSLRLRRPCSSAAAPVPLHFLWRGWMYGKNTTAAAASLTSHYFEFVSYIS